MDFMEVEGCPYHLLWHNDLDIDVAAFMTFPAPDLYLNRLLSSFQPCIHGAAWRLLR